MQGTTGHNTSSVPTHGGFDDVKGMLESVIFRASLLGQSDSGLRTTVSALRETRLFPEVSQYTMYHASLSLAVLLPHPLFDWLFGLLIPRALYPRHRAETKGRKYGTLSELVCFWIRG